MTRRDLVLSIITRMDKRMPIRTYIVTAAARPPAAAGNLSQRKE